MASLDIDSRGGGKKAVDAAIPLIPFIDLLLCCVMFLLVTAVWNQLASHDAVQNVPGRQTADDVAPEALRIVLQVGVGGYVVSTTAGDRFEIPIVDGGYDRERLEERLRAYRQALPNERALTLAADDGVAYDAVVQAMDSAAAQGFTGLALSDT